LLMGMQVNLSSFAKPGTVALAAVLTLAALLGKVICGVAAGPVDRLSVGLGMVARGGAGLILGGVGKGPGGIDGALFSAGAFRVTTMVGRIALKWSLGRHPAAAA